MKDYEITLLIEEINENEEFSNEERRNEINNLNILFGLN